jgi:hypothetical protein
MAKVKRKSTPKAPTTTKKHTKLTLADITVTWPGGEGVTRTADGRALAWLLMRAAHLTGNPKIEMHGSAQGMSPTLLRGLGTIVSPDAGTPISEIDDDRRSFLDWVLGELAAQLHADLLDAASIAERFTVTIGPRAA